MQGTFRSKCLTFSSSRTHLNLLDGIYAGATREEYSMFKIAAIEVVITTRTLSCATAFSRTHLSTILHNMVDLFSWWPFLASGKKRLALVSSGASNQRETRFEACN